MGANMRFSLAGLFEHKLDYSRPNRFFINILTLSDRIACSLQNGIKNLYVEHYVGAIGKRANLYTMKKDVFKQHPWFVWSPSLDVPELQEFDLLER